MYFLSRRSTSLFILLFGIVLCLWAVVACAQPRMTAAPPSRNEPVVTSGDFARMQDGKYRVTVCMTTTVEGTNTLGAASCVDTVDPSLQNAFSRALGREGQDRWKKARGVR